MKKTQKMNRKRKYFIVVFIALVGSAILCSLFLFSQAFIGNGIHINADNASKYGEFVGGYVGTILSIISIIILLLTLIDQSNSSELQKFESKYFDMIKMHRDNVSEIGIGEDFGRKVFVLLLREYRVIHKLVKKYLVENNLIIPDEIFFDFCYKLFYYGTGLNSTRMLLSSIPDLYINTFNNLIFDIGRRHIKERFMRENNLKYIPFEGHQSRLGHYYRHIFQTIRYVDKQDDSFISSDEKYNYVKILRAQLSTHEQALFFLNSLSTLGMVWRDEEQQISISNRGKVLMVTYQLIKNLPNDFFDKVNEIDPAKVFPKIKFEWNDYDKNSPLPLYEQEKN